MTPIKGDIYGVFRKMYEQPTDDTTKQIMSELKEELSSSLDNQDDYDIECIIKSYFENGVIPVWSVALKATREVSK